MKDLGKADPAIVEPFIAQIRKAKGGSL
jgi:hypothetical protein